MPEDLARGPHVPTWADPEALAQFETADDTDRGEAGWACMLTARRNWSVARRAWLEDHEIPSREQCQMIPSRRPFW